jgi:serine/threonine protein kinase
MQSNSNVLYPVQLDTPKPGLAKRIEYTRPDGQSIKQLVTIDGNFCIQFIRTLQEALMGKVKSAIVCVKTSNGNYEPPPSKTPHTLVAVKQLIKACVHDRVTRLGKPVREDPIREVAVLAKLQDPGSPYVMRLLQFLEDEIHYYIIYEYLNSGELFEQVSKHGKLAEQNAAALMWDTLQGVQYIHKMAVAHRDLSLENVMLHDYRLDDSNKHRSNSISYHTLSDIDPQQLISRPVAKLIDFGLAVVMPKPDCLLQWDGKIGKERYMAPETFAGLSYNGQSIDIWCCGMMLFVMLFGTYPYKIPSASFCPYFQQIAEGNFLVMLKGWGYNKIVSENALSLIDRMLTADPRKRATIDEVLLHPFFNEERLRMEKLKKRNETNAMFVDDASVE